MTIGISEERLEELLRDGLPGVIDYKTQCLGFIALLLRDECTELNPWLPIESAPKDRRVLLYNPKIGIFSGVIGDSISAWNCDPTHWQELPENPK